MKAPIPVLAHELPGHERASAPKRAGTPDAGRVADGAMVDRRAAATGQRALQGVILDSPRMAQRHAAAASIHDSPRVLQRLQQTSAVLANATHAAGPPAAPTNRTGLPDQLKSGIETLSGLSMDHVRVHYNSARPAQLHAHAYAQGTEIHLAPGQEKHLPHEAWHVVQQAQGRVRAIRQLKDTDVNDDPGLEREADRLGQLAVRYRPAGGNAGTGPDRPTAPAPAPGVRSSATVQRVLELNGIVYDTAKTGRLAKKIKDDAKYAKREPAAVEGDIKAMKARATEPDVTYHYEGLGPYRPVKTVARKPAGVLRPKSAAGTSPVIHAMAASAREDDSEDDDVMPTASPVVPSEAYPASMAVAYRRSGPDMEERKEYSDEEDERGAERASPFLQDVDGWDESELTQALALSAGLHGFASREASPGPSHIPLSRVAASAELADEREEKQAPGPGQAQVSELAPHRDERPATWGDYEQAQARPDDTQRFGLEIELKATHVPYGPRGRGFHKWAVEHGHKAIKRQNGLELHLDHGSETHAILEIVLSPGLPADAFIAKLRSIKRMLDRTADKAWLNKNFGNVDSNDTNHVHIYESLSGTTTITGNPVQITTTHTVKELKKVIAATTEQYMRVHVPEKHDSIDLRKSVGKLSDEFIVREYLARARPAHDKKTSGKGSNAMIKHAAEQFDLYRGDTRPPGNTPVGRIDADTPHLNALHTHANKPAPVFTRKNDVAYVVEYRSSSDLTKCAADYLSDRRKEQELVDLLKKYRG